MKEDSQKFLDRAAHAIHGAGLLAQGDEPNLAAGRAYYAMFYCAEALLHERGLRFRRHSAVHAAFGQHFARTAELDPKLHRWLLEAFSKRLEADYGIETFLDDQDVARLLEQAREFLDQTRRYLEKAP